VLGSVGIPTEGVALLPGVDRILDMSRTSINVAGDLVASKLMDHWVGGDEGAVATSPPVAAMSAADDAGGRAGKA
jgi:Na+/H+-dicarboxylate symporter